MTKALELDLAFDAAPAALLDDSSPHTNQARLSDPEAWTNELVAWIELIRADAHLTCYQQVRSATAISLGLQFCDDATMASLNGAWRQQPQATDVLAFAALEGEAAEAGEPCVELGDIIVSVETARRQAREQGHGLLHELRWLVSHGVLHLLGWDHPDEEQLNAMLQCQERLLDTGGKVQPHGVISCDSTDGITSAV